MRGQLRGRAVEELLRRRPIGRHNANVGRLPEETPYNLVEQELGRLDVYGSGRKHRRKGMNG